MKTVRIYLILESDRNHRLGHQCPLLAGVFYLSKILKYYSPSFCLWVGSEIRFGILGQIRKKKNPKSNCLIWGFGKSLKLFALLVHVGWRKPRKYCFFLPRDVQLNGPKRTCCLSGTVMLKILQDIL